MPLSLSLQSVRVKGSARSRAWLLRVSRLSSTATLLSGKTMKRRVTRIRIFFQVIRISDIAPIGFENLLRYAYTDNLKLETVDDAMLTAFAAKKYILPHLLKDCFAFIERNVTPSTVCQVK